MVSIAELLLEQGRQAANARRFQGEQSAAMWSGLGNSLAQSLTEYAKQKQEQPFIDAQRKIAIAQAGKVDEDTALKTLFHGEKPPTPQQIIGVVGPERGVAIVKGLAALEGDPKKGYADTQAVLRDTLQGMNALPETLRSEYYPSVRNHLIQKGVIKSDDAPEQYDPAWWQTTTNYGQAPKAPDSFTLNPGQTRFTGTTPVASVPAPEEKLTYAAPQWYLVNGQKTLVRPASDGTIRDTKGAIIPGEQLQPLPDKALPGEGSSDVKDAVAAMKAGTVPPILPGRASKDYVALLAEAKRQNYDLAGAATDWMATQKHIASMNGQQQLRLNQSINALPDLLDSVDTLASKWKGGRFPVLNKANLAAAKNGAYGKEVASVATQLDSQIADVVADLGTVYMGGNTPTDHSLGLAAKSLNGEWDERVLHDMVKLAKSNVDIRKNSINNTGVAGASDANPYVTQPVPSHETLKPPPTIPEGVVITRGR